MSKKCVRLTFALSALGIASVGWAQTPVQLNYTRVVDLSLPRLKRSYCGPKA